ncbi:hypothetical protein JW710_04440 [Candidatus Dojkabacteria bacterium]|nr:hypothetical protein [Candidatus Dojkabacteria bacterium]
MKLNNGSGDTDERTKKQFFIENIARFCDKCGKAYDINDVEILQHDDYSTIIHFSCQNCKARHLATFIKPLGVSSRMPVNTDLSIKEIKKFAGKKSISSNDIIDVHELFKNSKFSITDLLEDGEE